MTYVHALLRRTWAVALGLVLALVYGLVEMASWHPSHFEPPFTTPPLARWAAWFGAPLWLIPMSPQVLVPLDLVLLALVAAHPVHPRWWTAVITVLGVMAWCLLGQVLMGIGV